MVQGLVTDVENLGLYSVFRLTNCLTYLRHDRPYRDPITD